MKGNEELIRKLDELLADELTLASGSKRPADLSRTAATSIARINWYSTRDSSRLSFCRRDRHGCAEGICMGKQTRRVQRSCTSSRPAHGITDADNNHRIS